MKEAGIFYYSGFTLQSCWPWLSSSNGCLVKHLLHANNAVGSFVELILAPTGALFGPVALLLFSAGRIPQNLDADAFFLTV